MRKYFVNPDSFYTPKISLSPFTLNKDLSSKYAPSAERILEVLGPNLFFTSSGKEAIRLALKHLELSRVDTVGIFTTSGNSYISRCVTETIEEFCKWELGKETTKYSCLFLIHEFGNLIDLKDMDYFRSTGIPIINDFAYSFLSLYNSKRKDFREEINLTSLPKSFDINFGGVLSLRNDELYIDDREIRFWILQELGLTLNDNTIETNIQKRLKNQLTYCERLTKVGLDVVWNKENDVPGVCMITPRKSIDLQHLKVFLQRNGIESSVFYGRQSFFVPVHQNLSEVEIDFICYMLGVFINND
jgi:hypothetical protein